MRSGRKGQTAMEYLFLMAVILLSVSALVTSYVKTDSATSLTAIVRNSGNLACSYINSGVTTNSTGPYKYLNDAIAYLNYRNPLLSLKSVNVTNITSGTTLSLNITFSAGTSLNSTARSKLAGWLKNFMADYLIKRGTFSGSVQHPIYRNKNVTMEVRVVES